jgi:hypothetical protein
MEWLQPSYLGVSPLLPSPLLCQPNAKVCFYPDRNTLSNCHNPSFGFATKARGCKVASQEGNPGVKSHAPRNAKE